MSVFNLKTAALAIAAGVGLSGCAYGPYGGLGVGVGYGNGYGYDDGYYGGGYYGAGYDRYGYGYGQPYYGWYDGYYYPGTGYYVYDNYRRPHRWSDAQRHYWESRQQGSHTSRRGTTGILQNWVDFQNGPQANTNTANRTVRQRTDGSGQVVRREVTAEQRAAWAERRQQNAEQRTQRAERRSTRVDSDNEGTTERRDRRGRSLD
jgi:hypothetical protein